MFFDLIDEGKEDEDDVPKPPSASIIGTTIASLCLIAIAAAMLWEPIKAIAKPIFQSLTN